MKRPRLTGKQTIGILREQETGQKTADVCHHGVSKAMLDNAMVKTSIQKVLSSKIIERA